MSTEELVRKLRATGGGGQSGPLKQAAADAIERLSKAPPQLAIEDQLEVLNMIATIRRLRAELDPFAISPAVERVRQLTARQQSAIFDLLHAIDQLFPGEKVLFAEAAE